MNRRDIVDSNQFPRRGQDYVIYSTSNTQLNEHIATDGKIGSNLNQIAKHLNSDGAITKEIVDEVRNASLDLADLKYEILKIVGDAYGNN